MQNLQEAASAVVKIFYFSVSHRDLSENVGGGGGEGERRRRREEERGGGRQLKNMLLIVPPCFSFSTTAFRDLHFVFLLPNITCTFKIEIFIYIFKGSKVLQSV